MASNSLVGLVAAQATARDRLTRMAMRAAAAQARNLNFYDTTAITSATEEIVAHVEAAQRQAASLTDAYLARIVSQLRDRSTKPVGPVDVAVLRAGVTHAAAYGRLADQGRFLVSQGKPEPEARAQVTQRATVMAETDVDLAMRAQTARFTEVHHLRYRRVIHPELSTSGTCGLCVAASDRIYHKGQLMPIHDRCKCTVLPIVGAKDPGHSLNQADLSRLYAAAGGTGADKLKRVRVKERHHGELGPLLTDSRHRWRGPADVAA